MKKILLILGLLFFILSTNVLAYDLGDYPSPFMDDLANSIVSVGDSSPASDVVAAVDIQNSISDQLKVEIAAEVMKDRNKNIISIGNPCNNHLATLISDETECHFNLEPNQATIRSYEFNNFVHILVIGYSDLDTRRAAKVLAKYQDYGLKGNEVCILGSFREPQVIEGICDDIGEIVPVIPIEGFSPEECQDSDGGKNYHEKGLVTWANKNEKTELDDCCMESAPTGCSDSGPLLMERFCTGKYSSSFEVYSCPEGCVVGACKKITVKCGDGICHKKYNENNPRHSNYCPADCGVQTTGCGDGICDETKGEDSNNCPSDCDAVVNTCENGQKLDFECPDGIFVSWCSCLNNEWRCVNSPQTLCKTERICEGCLDENNVCIPISTRTETQYCDMDHSFKNQKSEDMNCINNYECSTNICVNNKCISSSFIQKIIDWFKNLFG
tara:strand:- start:176 stop:1501 length:1326 start_codon:yes stop_codon:yes gene_type:complete